MVGADLATKDVQTSSSRAQSRNRRFQAGLAGHFLLPDPPHDVSGPGGQELALLRGKFGKS